MGPRDQKNVVELQSAMIRKSREYEKVEKESEISWLNTAISALATLLAAFLGAGFAFLLADRERRRKELATAVSSGNRAIFTLYRQWNEVSKIKRQFINEFRSHSLKSIAIRPSLPLGYDYLKFDIDALSFLLDTEYRQYLMEMVVVEDKFQTAVRLFNERSVLHLQVVQPLLEEAGVVEGSADTKQDIDRVLGERLSAQLSRLTEDLIEHVDGAVVSTKAMSDKLHNALKRLYPGKVIINFKSDEGFENGELPRSS